MTLIDIRGVNHYYEWITTAENTSKPVMVFIHGWGGSLRYWRSLATTLSQDFNCLLYDLRGFGRSQLPSVSPNINYDLEEYAHDLAILLDKLKIDPVYLHSHSMGASIGALFLNLYPDRVVQAILTCNGIFEYNKLAFAAFHKVGGYVVKFRYNWFLKFPFADRLFMARFLNRPIDDRDRQQFLEDFLLAHPLAAEGTIYTSVNKRAVEIMPVQFAKIQVPTLMISGAKDRIIPASMGKKAAQLNPKLEYLEIPNTGHFPMLEDPIAYLKGVRDFLQVTEVVA